MNATTNAWIPADLPAASRRRIIVSAASETVSQIAGTDLVSRSIAPFKRAAVARYVTELGLHPVNVARGRAMLALRSAR